MPRRSARLKNQPRNQPYQRIEQNVRQGRRKIQQRRGARNVNQQAFNLLKRSFQEDYSNYYKSIPKSYKDIFKGFFISGPKISEFINLGSAGLILQLDDQSMPLIRTTPPLYGIDTVERFKEEETRIHYPPVINRNTDPVPRIRPNNESGVTVLLRYYIYKRTGSGIQIGDFIQKDVTINTEYGNWARDTLYEFERLSNIAERINGYVYYAGNFLTSWIPTGLHKFFKVKGTTIDRNNQKNINLPSAASLHIPATIPHQYRNLYGSEYKLYYYDNASIEYKVNSIPFKCVLEAIQMHFSGILPKSALTEENVRVKAKASSIVGMNAYNIQNFCIEYKCKLVLVDFMETIILKYTPKNRRVMKTFIGAIIGKHLYLVTDQLTRQKLLKCNTPPLKAATGNVFNNVIKDRDMINIQRILVNNIEEVVEHYNSELSFALLVYVYDHHSQINKIVGRLINETDHIFKSDSMIVDKMNNISKLCLKKDNMLFLQFVERGEIEQNSETQKFLEENDVNFKRSIYIRSLTTDAVSFMENYTPVNFYSSLNEDVLNLMYPAMLATHIAYFGQFNHGINFAGTPKKNRYNGVKQMDIIRCYTNCILDNTENYPVFTVFDEILPVNTAYLPMPLKPGWYIIKTDNEFPLRGNGAYSHVILNYAFSEDIDFIITHVIQAGGISQNSRIFKKGIEELKNMTHGKKLVNSFYGFTGIVKSFKKKIYVTDDTSDALTESIKYGHRIVNLSNDNKQLWGIIRSLEMYKYHSLVHVYFQTIENAWIKIHRLYKTLIDNGYKAIALVTDCVYFLERPLFTRYSQTYLDTITGVRINNDVCDIGNLPKIRYNNETGYNNFISSYNANYYKPIFAPMSFHVKRIESLTILVQNDKPLNKMFLEEQVPQSGSPEFGLFIKYLLSLKGCVISGKAGCGKTTILRALSSELEKQGIDVMKLAYTNAAANQINGSTFHRKLCITLDDKKFFIFRGFPSVKTAILLDEASMNSIDLWILMAILTSNSNITHFYVFGDHRQLQPVSDVWRDRYRFDTSTLVRKLCRGNVLYLNKVCRQIGEEHQLWDNIANDPFLVFKYVPKVYEIDEIEKDDSLLTATNLSYLNKTRQKVNRMVSEKIHRVYGSVCRTLSFKEGVYNVVIGSKVISCHNFITKKKHDGVSCSCNKDINILFAVNDIGVITHISDTEVNITINDINIIVKAKAVKDYFNIGYCYTIHKSQGRTISERYSIYDIEKFETMGKLGIQLLYTGITRTRSIKNIQLIKSL